jgi:hypothetical protein
MAAARQLAVLARPPSGGFFLAFIHAIVIMEFF